MEQTVIQNEDQLRANKMIMELAESVEIIKRSLIFGESLSKQEAKLLSSAMKSLVAVRNADICMAQVNGEKLSATARKWNLTPGRVSQICKVVDNKVKEKRDG